MLSVRNTLLAATDLAVSTSSSVVTSYDGDSWAVRSSPRSGLPFAFAGIVGGMSAESQHPSTTGRFMAERKNLDGLKIRKWRDVAVLDLGRMDIWDGADLSLLRDGLNKIIVQDRYRSVGVDMSSVKYVPSGFFGMLFDWFEEGVSVWLFRPRTRVRNMLWFRTFFAEEVEGCFLLHSGAPREAVRGEQQWSRPDWPKHSPPATPSSSESTVTASK